jgi:mannan endo-1,4-beta-mannosidase
VRPMLEPSRKYLGVAINGAPEDLAPVNDFAAKIGKSPNILEYYAAWGDQYETEWNRNAWRSGALPMMAWEPFKPSVADIANGASDHYIREFAEKVRKLNLPVAISFGHEMNGFWYPWGTEKTKASDFVRAWRHVHDVFLDVGAANVIWVWSPNVINPVPNVPLEPFYPGHSYVDWIGLVGYYSRTGAHTFETLFGPTMKRVREFSQKPFLIAETAAQPGPGRSRRVADLFEGVAAADDVIGFVWFEHDKQDADWRVSADSAALGQFKRHAANRLFGFDPTKT